MLHEQLTLLFGDLACYLLSKLFFFILIKEKVKVYLVLSVI